ncbi:hypothetical protein QYE76_066523 [Lolium multiflorum]|uniref:Chromo domain-containing protein n=1 Tax=Lolium multiflorum TaxID=4521 RepID=A0AAD8SCG2_LOLMU|nr:hypothetical protein QYE76_066523 [Lolium multiflorum]
MAGRSRSRTSSRSRNSSKDRSNDDAPILGSASTTDAEIAALRAQQRQERDARSLGRRLRNYQAESSASINMLTNQMGSMVATMDRMQTSINKLLQPEGLGVVLMQEAKPLAYFSRALGPKNAAMSVYEKEALAILEALKKWRHYFLGNKLVIKTNQCSLKYLASQRLLEGIQHKLMLKLLEFDYSIQYKKGTDNSAADALSRKYQHVDLEGEQGNCQALAVAIPSWTNDIITSYLGDATSTKLLQEVPRREGDYEVAVPQWLIKWDGLTEDDATWEDADFIMKTFPAFKP